MLVARRAFGYNPSVSRSFIEDLIRKKPLYRGKAVSFCVDEVRLPNGRTATREYVDHPGAAAVVPFLDRDTVVLVRQYRYPVGAVTYEIPAGKLDAGERPLRCIRRELEEETGYAAGRFKRLLSFWPAPAFSNEVLHIYVAEDLRPGRFAPDEDEFLDSRPVPFDKALDWIRTGRIQDAKTIIGLQACALRRR